MKYYHYMFFYMIMILLSTMFSSLNWFQLWMILEINMFMFIPIMFLNESIKTINSMMIYFFIQSFASSLILLNMLIFNNIWYNNFFSIILMVSLNMKIGMWPIFFWFPQISEGINWLIFYLLSSIQKIFPLYILSFSFNKLFLFFIIIISSYISCMNLFNITSLRKLMAFSSLINLSWSFSMLLTNNNNFFFFLFFYFFLLFLIIFLNNKFSLNTIYSLNSMNYYFSMNLLICFMSLSGLPPFLGFFPKWMILFNMNLNNYLFFFLMILLMFFSFLSIFIYLRIFFNNIFSKKNNFFLMKSNLKINNWPTLMNSFLLIPMIPFL